jgi:TfoX/Sxy family transcriptional regulator of competence genes
MSQKNIPCDFVFDYLMPLEVTVKPMFGVWAIYVDKKIMLVLKQRKDSPENKRRMDCPPRSITKFKKGVAFVMLISIIPIVLRKQNGSYCRMTQTSLRFPQEKLAT